MGHTSFGKFTVLKFFLFFVFFLNGNCFVSEQNLTNSRTVWGYKSWTGIQQMRWADMARMCVCVWKRGLHSSHVGSILYSQLLIPRIDIVMGLMDY